MNDFDGPQFTKDYHKYLEHRVTHRPKWRVTLRPWGWTVTGPNGGTELARGFSRSDWRFAYNWAANEAAKAGHR